MIGNNVTDIKFHFDCTYEYAILYCTTLHHTTHHTPHTQLHHTITLHTNTHTVSCRCGMLTEKKETNIPFEAVTERSTSCIFILESYTMRIVSNSIIWHHIADHFLSSRFQCFAFSKFYLRVRKWIWYKNHFFEYKNNFLMTWLLAFEVYVYVYVYVKPLPYVLPSITVL
jgi:hypothetical protein